MDDVEPIRREVDNSDGFYADPVPFENRPRLRPDADRPRLFPFAAPVVLVVRRAIHPQRRGRIDFLPLRRRNTLREQSERKFGRSSLRDGEHPQVLVQVFQFTRLLRGATTEPDARVTKMAFQFTRLLRGATHSVVLQRPAEHPHACGENSRNSGENNIFS